MPLVNYCRKCKAETPLGDSCAYCGGKLTQTGERVSFGAVITPARDWFTWNGLLRVCLAPLGLVALIAMVCELAAGGLQGVAALLDRGFLRVIIVILLISLAAIYLALLLQGRESVHYVLDKDGVRALSYVVNPRPWQLYSRFISPASLEAPGSEDALEGYTLVRRVSLPWAEIRRMGLWRENRTLLLYRPRFWLALAVRCPVDDFAPAEAYARKKLKRHIKLPPDIKKS